MCRYFDVMENLFFCVVKFGEKLGTKQGHSEQAWRQSFTSVDKSAWPGEFRASRTTPTHVAYDRIVGGYFRFFDLVVRVVVFWLAKF
jgi:hypothetical protein